MTPDDEDRVTGEAVRFLAESLLEVGGKVEALPGRLAELEQRERERAEADEIREEREKDRERHQKRVIHRLIGAVAVLALLVAGVSAGFLFAFHGQDVRFRQEEASRATARQVRDAQIAQVEAHLAVVQAQNTRFREGFCKMDKSLRVYLAQAPAGPAAGQDAARQVITDLIPLCPK